MTLDIAKVLLPIIKAFSEGKQIQYFNIIYNKWEDIDSPKFDDEPSRYRIKPEPKYRSFKSVEECLKEMQKHQPFGWVKSKINLSLYHIDIIGYNNLIHVDNAYRGLEAIFQTFEFTDGSPFGIKEE